LLYSLPMMASALHLASTLPTSTCLLLTRLRHRPLMNARGHVLDVLKTPLKRTLSLTHYLGHRTGPLLSSATSQTAFVSTKGLAPQQHRRQLCLFNHLRVASPKQGLSKQTQFPFVEHQLKSRTEFLQVLLFHIYSNFN